MAEADGSVVEAVEVDPKKLISKNGVIGYEKPDGFLAMTNFDLTITGFVAESSGAVIGYLAEVRLDIVANDINQDTSRTKEYFLSNKDMSSHQNLINALKSAAIWTQPAKEPYLPDYIYGLCRRYSKTTPAEQQRKKIPVTVIGKQPEEDVWVFNDTVQINGEGHVIRKQEQEYILLDDSRLPFLRGLKENTDDGAALRRLIEAEKDLLGNNFPQAVMTLACCAIGANYGCIVKEYGGCGIPVLYGAPQSAKTTALKAALSVFGESDVVQDMTFKAVMDRASATTIPFGWDDAENSTMIKQVAVAFFNQGGTLSYHGRSVPMTFPIMTTNVDGKSFKVLSRWMRIPFKELHPIYRSREFRERYQRLLEAMENASSSISVVTSFIAKMLGKKEDVDIVTETLNNVCDNKDLQIDQRAMLSFSLLLFVSKTILEKVGLPLMVPEIEESMEEDVLPSYASAATKNICTKGKKAALKNKNTNNPLIKEAIMEVLGDITQDSVQSVAHFVTNKIEPKACTCGKAVAFNVPLMMKAITLKNPNNTLSDSAIRTYIVEERIGCVGKSTKFIKGGNCTSSAHVSRAFIPPAILEQLDRAFLNPRSTVPGCSGIDKEQVKAAVRQPQSTNHQSEEDIHIDNSEDSGLIGVLHPGTDVVQEKPTTTASAEVHDPARDESPDAAAASGENTDSAREESPDSAAASGENTDSARKKRDCDH
ncbi:uncharacterized protein LOC144646922 [Oculina patagonica]